MTFYGLDLTLSYSGFRPIPDSHGVRISIQQQLDNRQSFLEISQTETVFDLPSASFKQVTTIPYRFDSSQLLRFQVLRVADESETLTGREGEVDVALASLACSPVPVSLTLPSGVCITAQLRVPPTYNDYIRLRFAGEHLKSFNNYSLAAYFIVVLVSDKRTLLLYKSEVVRAKEAKWAGFRIPVLPLESSPSSSLQVHVFNDNTNARDSLIGYFTTTFAQLMQRAGMNTYMLMDQTGMRRSEKVSMELKSVERDSGPSFFDAMRSGCDLRPAVAVDFTASNGSPLDRTSLHFIHPHELGPYAHSIATRLAPITLHTRDARISALGFGAKVGPQLQMSNCFQLDPSAENVYGLPGVLTAYRKASMALQPFGPTQYADVIYHTSKFAKASTRLHMNAFFVLVIFTDGCPQLCPRTVDALVDASFAPMAVFFVLVGQARDERRAKEAAALRQAQCHPLKHSDGRVAARQISTVISEEDGDEGIGLLPAIIAQWKNLSESTA